MVLQNGAFAKSDIISLNGTLCTESVKKYRARKDTMSESAHFILFLYIHQLSSASGKCIA